MAERCCKMSRALSDPGRNVADDFQLVSAVIMSNELATETVQIKQLIWNTMYMCVIARWSGR